jgi:uncharacterized repeat protein (TIGR03847 family)
MPRRRYIFDPPDRFVAGAIGEPGDRAFFLQAREGRRVVSVALEKVQVAVLAERLGALLEELGRRGVPEVTVDALGEPSKPVEAGEPDPEIGLADAGDDVSTLDEPLNEAFRAGSLTLG